MHCLSIVSLFAALYLDSGYARSVDRGDQSSTLPEMTEIPASAITMMPNGNPYLNKTLTNSTSLSDRSLSERGKTLKIMHSNGFFSGSTGQCGGANPTTFTYFNGFVGSAICISASGTNCMMQGDPANKFTVCNKAGCGSQSGTICTNSDNLQLGEPNPTWEYLGYDYMYAAKGTNSIHFDPNA